MKISRPAPWERDDGQPPAGFTWAQPTGGAFAALIGLTGTGLLGEVRNRAARRRPQLRGPMDAFSQANNHWNAPIPTIVPKLDLALPATDHEFALIRQRPRALVKRTACRLPAPKALPRTGRRAHCRAAGRVHVLCRGADAGLRTRPISKSATDNKWRVNLRRGQKTFRLLNYRWAGRASTRPHIRPAASEAWRLFHRHRL